MYFINKVFPDLVILPAGGYLTFTFLFGTSKERQKSHFQNSSIHIVQIYLINPTEHVLLKRMSTGW